MCRPLAVVAARRRRHRNTPKKTVKSAIVKSAAVDATPKVTLRNLAFASATPRDVASEPRFSKFEVGEPLPKKRRVMSSVALANDTVMVEPNSLVSSSAPAEHEEPKTLLSSTGPKSQPQNSSSSERMSKLELLFSSLRSSETMNELSDLFSRSAEKIPECICARKANSIELTDDILHGLFNSHKSSRVNSLEMTDDVFHELFKSKESLDAKKAIASSLERTDNIFHGLFSAEKLGKEEDTVSVQNTEDLFDEFVDSREAVAGSLEKTDDVFHGMFMSEERCKTNSVEKVNPEAPKEAVAKESKTEIYDYQNSCFNITTYVQETDALIELLMQALKEKTERIKFLERAIRAVF